MAGRENPCSRPPIPLMFISLQTTLPALATRPQRFYRPATPFASGLVPTPCTQLQRASRPSTPTPAPLRLCLMAQIETGDAMRRLEELASVDDVDLFIGPADLAASLGFPGQTSHPDVQTAAADLVKAARSHNKAVATACASEDFPFWISLDIDLLFCANDIACLKKAAGDIPGEARETLESRVTSV